MRLSWSNAIWLWTLLPLAVLGLLSLAYRLRDSRRRPRPASFASKPPLPPKT